jgi:hypothetical protein
MRLGELGKRSASHLCRVGGTLTQLRHLRNGSRTVDIVRTMSLSIDLTTHGKELQSAYERIIAGAADTAWAVFSYDRGASNELKVQATGGAIPCQ